MKSIFETIELIFNKIYLKIHVNSSNISQEFLSLDLLKKEAKLYLLSYVLYELKTFLITELYYQSKVISFKPDRFFELILLRVKRRLEKDFLGLKRIEISSNEFNWLISYLEAEEGECLKLLFGLISADSGSTYGNCNIGFDSFKLIASFLENLIIKIANIFIYLMFFDFSLKKYIPAELFYSNTEFSKSQKNNFYWKTYLTSKFSKPKYIYYELFNVFVLNKYGITSKWLYIPSLSRKEKYTAFNIQLFILFYFELIDFFYPKFFRMVDQFQQTFEGNLYLKAK